MKRRKDYYRKMRAKAIRRKKRIIRNYMPNSLPKTLDSGDIFNPEIIRMVGVPDDVYYYVKHDGELSKGKIHCSCWMCACTDVPVQDKRNLDRLEESLRECEADYNLSKEINRIERRKNKRSFRRTAGKKSAGSERNGEAGIGEYKYEQLFKKFMRTEYGSLPEPETIEDCRKFIRDNSVTRDIMDGWLRKELEPRKSPWYGHCRYCLLRFLVSEVFGLDYYGEKIEEELAKLSEKYNRKAA